MPAARIEVELRVPLDDRGYERLVHYLEAHGTMVKRQNRFLIDYSTFIEGIGERKLDVRVRVTNGRPEIVVKQGAFGGPTRQEASVFVANNDLAGVLSVMALLGYRRGVACDRAITRYLVGDIEIAIQDVRDYHNPGRIHSRFFEAEIECSDEEKALAEARVRNLLDQLGFQPFSTTEWNDYVALMNREANGVFDYDKDDLASVRAMGQDAE